MPQFFSAFLAMLPGFTFGSLLAFAAVALPQVLACLAYKSLSLRKLDPVGSTVRYEVMSYTESAQDINGWYLAVLSHYEERRR